MRTILLNSVDRPSAGHTIEALRYAQGFHVANPDSEVHVALSDRAVPVLTTACPWISRTYAVDLDNFENPDVDIEALKDIPKEWDYIVDNILDVPEENVPADEQAILRYFESTSSALTARVARGSLYPNHDLPEGLGYTPRTRVTLDVPAENRSVAARRYPHDGPKIAIMLGGSIGRWYYPDTSSWIKIVAALSDALPSARFYLTGVHQSAGKTTYTAGYTDEDVAAVLASAPGVVDCYDIGLWNQIALFERCDALISPSTGFSWLALCVGTPWLTISGGYFPEYFFNDVPFYRVLPDDPEYPYRGVIDPMADSPRLRCMEPRNLDKKIPEIVMATQLLMEPSFTYDEAMARHRTNVARANVDHHRITVEPDPLF